MAKSSSEETRNENFTAEIFLYYMSKVKYTVKFDIMEPSVPLVKFFKIPLYRGFRYIENKLIIDYDNPF